MKNQNISKKPLQSTTVGVGVDIAHFLFFPVFYLHFCLSPVLFYGIYEFQYYILLVSQFIITVHVLSFIQEYG